METKQNRRLQSSSGVTGQKKKVSLCIVAHVVQSATRVLFSQGLGGVYTEFVCFLLLSAPNRTKFERDLLYQRQQ
jgi:hypothetical protein